MSDRILMIIESPNKIATIRQFLPSNYTIMASVGHISQIKDGGGYWNTGIDPKENFRANFAVNDDKDTKERVKALKEQVKIASKVILATDPDREGEAIAWSLKKFLNIPDKKYERVTFHEITKNAVLNALQHPRKINESLVSAAHTRSILDKMLGYRLTNVVKKALQARSAGRCQSAALKLICDREHEIMDFDSHKFYEVWYHFTKNNKAFKAKYVGTKDGRVDKIEDIKEASDILETCQGPFTILNIDSKVKKEYPKPPFTTSDLYQEANTKLGFQTKKTKDLAQKLFEGINVGGKHISLITYIRTDSSDLAPEFVPLLENHVKSTYGNKYYAPLREVKKQENAQEGHEAIRCVDLDMTPAKLSEKLLDKHLVKLYELIYRRTVAAMMKPCEINETLYTISSGDGRLFEFTIREEIFDGFKKAYRYEEDDEEAVAKETFNLKEELNTIRLEMVEKKTKPKPRYKESTAIKKFEDTGIGRPSTYETMLATILDKSRGYCTIEDGYIVPTELGLEVSKYLDDKFPTVINVAYTSQMEKGLDEIEQAPAEADAEALMLKFLTDFYTNLEESVKNAGITSTREMSDETCPLCGSQMVVRTGPHGKFLGCSKFPKCKGVKKIDNDAN